METPQRRSLNTYLVSWFFYGLCREYVGFGVYSSGFKLYIQDLAALAETTGIPMPWTHKHPNPKPCRILGMTPPPDDERAYFPKESM